MAGVAGFKPTPTALGTATLVLKTSVLSLHYTPRLTLSFSFSRCNQLNYLIRLIPSKILIWFIKNKISKQNSGGHYRTRTYNEPVMSRALWPIELSVHWWRILCNEDTAPKMFVKQLQGSWHLHPWLSTTAIRGIGLVLPYLFT